jgi:hypothetical protein
MDFRKADEPRGPEKATIMAVMDVVVPCDCGSRFSFSLEPVGDRIPEGAELLCPSCGKDGVPLANRVIGENLGRNARQLQKERAEFTPKRSSWAAKSPDKELPTDPPLTAHRDPFARARAEDENIYTGPNKARGMAGALLGASVGAAVWASVVYYTGYEIRYVAVAVGALAGFGSRFIGGGRDNQLGVFAAICALMGILVGQFLAARIYLDKTVSVELASMEYESKLEEAKEAASLKTADDFKDFIAAAKSTIFKPVAPSSITDKVMAEFQATELPILTKFAGGDPSRTAFMSQARETFLAKLTVEDVFNASITPYLFFWAFLGLGAAWKMASDYGTSVE